MKTSAGQSGFTVLELLVTITIGSILLAIAVPSFSTIVQNNRRSSYVNEFVRALNFARSEAVTLRKPVTMCRSANPTAATPACSTAASAPGWQQGWIVFSDVDGASPVANGTFESATDVVLLVHEAITASGTSFCGNTNVDARITFNKTGMSSTAGSIFYCDARGLNQGRSIVVSSVGRIRTEGITGSNTCLRVDDPLDCS